METEKYVLPATSAQLDLTMWQLVSVEKAPAPQLEVIVTVLLQPSANIDYQTLHFTGAGQDYTIGSLLSFNFDLMTSGERFCVDVSTFDDTLAEGTEQFELSFTSISPSDFATEGDPAVVCIDIQDNDSTCYILV